MALLGVNNGLCPEGVAKVLAFRLKETEKKLINAKQADDEYYDLALPPIHVCSKKLRELTVPEEDKKRLSFDPIEDKMQFVYHIEATEMGWRRLTPLVDIFIRSNDLKRTFGPKAHLLFLPKGRPSISDARMYQAKARIGMGVNLASNLIECSEVYSFDVEVKVKMAEIEEINPEDGTPTGRMITPPPPYKNTTLRRELAGPMLNNQPLFYTGVVTAVGSDTGISRLVYPYNPKDPANSERQKRVRHIAGNMAAWWYCYWTHVMGYSESTVKRLLNSFYFDRAVMAPDAQWDPERMEVKATGHVDNYIEENAEWDPFYSDIKEPNGKVEITFDDDTRVTLMNAVNYKPDRSIGEANSRRSALTGDSQTSGASSLRSETSFGAAVGRGANLKMELAITRNEARAAKEKAAEEMSKKDAEIEALKKQMEEVMAKIESGVGNTPASQLP
eukprot:scaffold5449_cov52-Cyclotella_meneghiniana.AAC.9